MADILLNVETRERTGKGGAREARRQGKIPGILYGGDKTPVAINLNAKEVIKAVNSGKFVSHTLRIDHKGEKQMVFAQAVQFDPVTDVPTHLDLYRVSETQQIKVNVPVRFVGDDVCPGIKLGGTLNVVRHDVELYCPANAIPEELVFDISQLDIGDTVKISATQLPKDVTPTITDRDFTIATIAGRAAKTAEETAEDAESEDAKAEDGAKPAAEKKD